jgi:hypothetical protein
MKLGALLTACLSIGNLMMTKWGAVSSPSASPASTGDTRQQAAAAAAGASTSYGKTGRSQPESAQTSGGGLNSPTGQGDDGQGPKRPADGSASSPDGMAAASKCPKCLQPAWEMVYSVTSHRFECRACMLGGVQCLSPTLTEVKARLADRPPLLPSVSAVAGGAQLIVPGTYNTTIEIDSRGNHWLSKSRVGLVSYRQGCKALFGANQVGCPLFMLIRQGGRTELCLWHVYVGVVGHWVKRGGRRLFLTCLRVLSFLARMCKKPVSDINYNIVFIS